MNFSDVIIEFLQSWLGGGTIVGIVSAVLLYKSSKKGRDIDWYDRAINQVKDLDKEVSELKDIIKSLNGDLAHEREEKEKLQGVVKKLESIISGLKIQIEDKIEDSKKKGSIENEKL